jgi:hypothetical protein
MHYSLRRKGTGLIVALLALFATSAAIWGGQQVGLDRGTLPPRPTPLPTPARAALPTLDPTQQARARQFLTAIPTPDRQAMAQRVTAAIATRAQAIRQQPSHSLFEETRGARITIAGREVQLPPDTYVAGTTAMATCYSDDCPDYPSLFVKRGNSSVYVGVRTGRITGELVGPGDTQPFAFLEEALAR